jgi:phosphoribosylformylglycinamidine synthase
VQIGDPITQKKMSDAIVKEARDRCLYNSITDNGAGGLSCSVAEMAKESGGFEVDLEKVPLKYPGLSPWQIWISESQERMTLAISPKKVDEFIALMFSRGVEATVIGTFTNSGRGVVRYNGEVIFDLDMNFLHDGLPRKELKTEYTIKSYPKPEFAELDHNTVLDDMLCRLNIASFEFISTQYDHEVQANSVIKPLQGKGRVNGNATVIRPIFDSNKGVVMSQGLYPSYSELDAYQMAACSIDTAVRNAIAAGGTLHSLALLDNFCWCDSTNPERLGQLKAAAEACYDLAVFYGTPYVSGKDSMFNDFKGYDKEGKEVKISVPPTLLISSIGVVSDVVKCQTIDFKVSGDRVYLLGKTYDELAASEFYIYQGVKDQGYGYYGGTVPRVDMKTNKHVYSAFELAIEKGLVASSISVERGGLAIALAKSAISGMLGVDVDLSSVIAEYTLTDTELLYSESQGRLLVTIQEENMEAFEKLFENFPCACIGTIRSDQQFMIKGKSGASLISMDVTSMLQQYKTCFQNY